MEGEARGQARGMGLGAKRLAELIKSGYSIEDALRLINEEQEALKTKEPQFSPH